MGRPIHLNMSNGKLNTSGKQINLASCWIIGDTAANTHSILFQQVGEHAFEVKNTVTGKVGIVSLVASVTGPGQATIVVTPVSGPVQHLKAIQSDRLETFEGHDFFWHANGSTPDATFAALPLS